MDGPDSDERPARQARHDLVYLAGHFSANDTLAADFSTTFDADELDPSFVRPTEANPTATNADKLKNTLVLSAGCHSGYNIVNDAAVPPTRRIRVPTRSTGPSGWPSSTPS